MSDNLGNSPALTTAIRRVLDGDVGAYSVIYEAIDKPLRSYVSGTYRDRDSSIRNEIADRTHTYVFENLGEYNPARAPFMAWVKLVSRNVGLRVLTERYNLRKVQGPDGRWQRLPTTIAMEEDSLALAARTVPGPEEEYFAKWQDHLLWKEYDALANEGRLSIQLRILEGRTLKETAALLKMPVIRLRRILDKELRRLRRRLLRQGYRPVERVPYYGRVRHDSSSTRYDDDWTSSQTVVQPVEPDPRSGTAAKAIEQEEG
jgi:DNA-directed RNA polymerase specialized sigma24 family protein